MPDYLPGSFLNYQWAGGGSDFNLGGACLVAFAWARISVVPGIARFKVPAHAEYAYGLL